MKGHYLKDWKGESEFKTITLHIVKHRHVLKSKCVRLRRRPRPKGHAPSRAERQMCEVETLATPKGPHTITC